MTNEPAHEPTSSYDQHGQTVQRDQINVVGDYHTHHHVAAPPITAPPRERCDFYRYIALPPNYIARPDLLAEIRTALLQTATNIALTSSILQADALFGMGGIGKTVMARALCDDPTVQAAFPHGILWATLGQTPDLPARLRDWIYALGDSVPSTALTVEALTNLLAESLENRRCLLIVDDVWERPHLERFMVDAADCRLLFTTRNAEIATEVQATIRPVPLLSQAQAIELLVEWSGGTVAHIPHNLQIDIIERLGRLPLALKLAGDQLRRHAPEQWLTSFDARKLSKHRPKAIHDSLEATFALSLADLTTEERRLFNALAIFKDDEAIPLLAIVRLWSALAAYDEAATTELLHYLADRALLQITTGVVPQPSDVIHPQLMVTFHDLIRDFMLAELGDENRHAGHMAILAAYRRSQTNGQWSGVPDDGYLYDHLVYHLSKVAEREPSALTELLQLFATPAWLQVRVPASGYRYDGYIAELETTWTIYLGASAKQAVNLDPQQLLLTNLRLGLLRTSINSLAANYGPSLVGYAVEMDIWPIERALSIFAQTPDPLHKTQLGCALLATGKLIEGDRSRIILQSLNIIELIIPVEVRLRIMVVLTHYLVAEKQDSFLTKLIAFITTIESEWLRVQAIILLFPLIGQQHHDNVLKLVSDLTASDHRTEAAMNFMLLAPNIGLNTKQSLVDLVVTPRNAIEFANILYRICYKWPVTIDRYIIIKAIFEISIDEMNELLQEFAVVMNAEQKERALQLVLEAASAVNNIEKRTDLLTILTSQFDTKEVLQQAYNAALTIPDQGKRVDALLTLIPHFGTEQREQALQQAYNAALTIPDQGERVDALLTLIPHFGTEQREQALQQAYDVVLAIQNKGYRAYNLAALTPQFKSEQQAQVLEQALNEAFTIQDEQYRAYVLMTLISHLSGEQRRQALQYAFSDALAIQDKGYRAYSLAALMPQLKNEQQAQVLQQVLDATLAIQDEQYRVYALITLVTRLNGKLQEQVLQHAYDAAIAIQDKGYRAESLIALVPYFSAEQREQVLQHAYDAAIAIQDKGYRVAHLMTLIPQLRSAQQMQILQQVQNLVFTIQDEEYRVYALMTIIPQLSNEEALQQAYKAIVAIHNEEKRIQGLRKLVPQLSQELKIQALLHVLKSILVLSDNKFRHSTLIWLRPYLSEIPIAHYCTLLQEVQDEWLRANLIEILLPYLDDKTYPMFTQVLSNIPDQLNRHRAEQILLTRPTPSTIQQQLQSAAAIRDELHRTRLYSVIAHQLRPQQLFRITDYVERELNKLALPTDLASIRLYLTSSSNKDTRDRLLTIATTLVASITDHAKRVKALIQLQPYLESDEQTAVIDQAIHTVQDIKDEQQRVRLLIQLALEVALPAEGETQGSVVTSILAMDDIMTRVKLLSALITRFEGNLRRIVIRQILIDAKKLDSAKSRAQAFAIVLPYLQGDARMTAFHRATSATYAIDDPMDRVTVLVKIAEAQINRRAFDEAKSIATTQLTGQAQAKAIALLLPLATELERHALLHKGLSAAMSIQDQTQRAMVLSSYLPYVKNAQPIRKIIYSVIGNTIREKSQTAKRAELLDYLATDPLIHSAQFPEETLLAMADTIAEISNDWTWL